MNKVKEIVIKTRQTGNTTWILKAAINNPDCIIIARNTPIASELEYHYLKMLDEVNWFRRMWWKILGRKHPIFSSIDYKFGNTKKPIIFDNSSLNI